MPTRLAALAVLAFVLLAPAGPARGEEPASPWRTLATLERRLAEACDGVEKVCGAPFERRPGVRISTPDQVEALLREELTPVLEATGHADTTDLVVSVARAAIVAKYDPAAHAIHVVPENVDRVAEATHEPAIATEEGLRAVLAHEAAHAHDFLRFPLVGSRAKAASADELEAWAAVVEGHAQWVAEQVAAESGLTDAFAAFTRSIAAVPDLPDEGGRRTAQALAARLAFAYVAGHDFMKAVHAARGREGMEAALRDPPKTRRAIENPAEWLEPAGAAKAPGIDVEGAIAVVGPWFDDPAWGVETDAVLRNVLASQMTTVEATRRDALLAAFEAGALVLGADLSRPAQVVAAALVFRTPEAAAEFVAVERTLLEAKDTMTLPAGAQVVDPVYSTGAGPGGAREGFVATKTLVSGEKRIPLVGHFALAGRAVAEVTLVGDAGVDRAAQDAAVEAMAAVLEGKASAPARLRRRAPELPEIEFPLDEEFEGLPRLRVLVLGPDGRRVPRSRVTIRVDRLEGGSGTQSFSTGVLRGRVTLPVLGPKATLSVEAPHDERGRPLGYAPKRVAVPPGATEMTVRLEPGLAIEGRVLRPDGSPAEGVVVAVVREDEHGHSPGSADEGASSPSGEDGAFRLDGVGPEEIAVVGRAAPGLAPGAPVRAKGGDRGVAVAMEPGVDVRLRIEDPDGEPVPGARVGLRRRDEWKVGASRGTRWTDVAEAESDDAGEAVLVGLPAHPDLVFDLDVHPPLDSDWLRVHRRGWKPQSVTFALVRGFTATGEVSDEAGAPVAGVNVHVGLSERPSVTTDRRGRFRVPGCPPDGVTLRLDAGHGLDGKGGEARATPEAPHVTLRWKPAPPAVAKRVAPPVYVSVPGGTGRTLVLRREDASGTDPDPLRFSIGAEGRAEVRGDLDRSASYVAWVPPEPGNPTSALRRGLRLDTPEPNVLTLEPVVAIRGRLSAPPGSKHFEVTAVSPEGFLLEGSRNEDGTYEIPGAPRGTAWNVRAKARAPTAWVYGAADAEAGGSVDLTLAPK